MVGDSNAYPVLAVKDLERAKRFYGETLELKTLSEQPGVGVFYKSGNGRIWVYLSGLAGTNEATALTWAVGDVEPVVAWLKDKGVTFEHYDGIEGMKREGEIHIAGGTKAAWFKDPDGNVLCVGNEE